MNTVSNPDSSRPRLAALPHRGFPCLLPPVVRVASAGPAARPKGFPTVSGAGPTRNPFPPRPLDAAGFEPAPYGWGGVSSRTDGESRSEWSWQISSLRAMVCDTMERQQAGRANRASGHDQAGEGVAWRQGLPRNSHQQSVSFQWVKGQSERYGRAPSPFLTAALRPRLGRLVFRL